jgi:hypothetical protein
MNDVKRTFSLDEETYTLLNNFSKFQKLSMSAVLRLLIVKNCRGKSEGDIHFNKQ